MVTLPGDTAEPCEQPHSERSPKASDQRHSAALDAYVKNTTDQIYKSIQKLFVTFGYSQKPHNINLLVKRHDAGKWILSPLIGLERHIMKKSNIWGISSCGVPYSAFGPSIPGSMELGQDIFPAGIRFRESRHMPVP
jgi:hypothetical protein